MEQLLEVKDLCRHYRDFDLSHITFTLPKGYIMGYIGPNGAGKTTTLNMIASISRLHEGEVRLDGISCAENAALFKEKIGYIGDTSYFPSQFKLHDIQSILKDFYPTFHVEKFQQFTKEWELPEKKKLSEYSRGMKVKLMFAAALSRDTKLLILDEATNGLDPMMRSDILKLLQEYIADGERSVLFSTHILSDLEQIADYIYFIDQGREILYDSKEELLEDYLLVKGDLSDLTEELKSALIGIDESSIGFTAILKADKAELLDDRFLYEKPCIDQIVVHFIKNRKSF